MIPPAADATQRGRPEQAGGFLRQSQVGDDRREDERVEHHVERVEHPSERGGNERAARCGRAVSPPGEQHLRTDGQRLMVMRRPVGATGESSRVARADRQPGRSRPSRIRRVSSCEPGVSPCVQIVSTRIGMSRPSIGVTTPSRAIRTARRDDVAGIVDDRAGPAARRQRAVGFVRAIGEAFRGHAQAGGLRRHAAARCPAARTGSATRSNAATASRDRLGQLRGP